MEAPEAINNLETVLRDLISQVMADKFGSNWIGQCGTTDKIQKWQQRQVEEAKKRDGLVPEVRLLSFADFTDLLPIVKKHWSLFKQCLGDKKVFEVYMGRLEDFRNAPMHSRHLVKFEQDLVQGMTGEIRNKITLYQTNIKAADRYFPRIEFVRDSFGRTAKDGEIVPPDITVHPGDEITFECSGWDPEDLPLAWILVVKGLRLPSETDKHTCTVVWQVQETDIGEGSFVRIELCSHRPWHRNSDPGHDGVVHFRYTVLPRDR